jgi:SEC-C motif domain protein
VSICPCGLGEPYEACCGPMHSGQTPAPDAERLMRSRYSAFAMRDADYLLRTWHPDHRPSRIDLDASREWQRLEVLGATRGSFLDTEGTVEFRAHYRQRGAPGSQHENSAFARLDGRWLYVAPA